MQRWEEKEAEFQVVLTPDTSYNLTDVGWGWRLSSSLNPIDGGELGSQCVDQPGFAYLILTLSSQVGRGKLASYSGNQNVSFIHVLCIVY